MIHSGNDTRIILILDIWHPELSYNNETKSIMYKLAIAIDPYIMFGNFASYRWLPPCIR